MHRAILTTGPRIGLRPTGLDRAVADDGGRIFDSGTIAPSVGMKGPAKVRISSGG